MNQNRILFLHFSCIPFHPPESCVEHWRFRVYFIYLFIFRSPRHTAIELDQKCSKIKIKGKKDIEHSPSRPWARSCVAIFVVCTHRSRAFEKENVDCLQMEQMWLLCKCSLMTIRTFFVVRDQKTATHYREWGSRINTHSALATFVYLATCWLTSE